MIKLQMKSLTKGQEERSMAVMLKGAFLYTIKSIINPIINPIDLQSVISQVTKKMTNSHVNKRQYLSDKSLYK